MADVIQLRHNLVQAHLTKLRDRTTPRPEFRAIVHRLTMLLAYEATKDLPVEPVMVQTPLAPVAGVALRARIGLAPILRAGLGMVDAVLSLTPEAEVWHLGFMRDEHTLQPVAYYNKLPPNAPVELALVLDPMLATGGSAIAALRALKQWGVANTSLLGIIAAPEGIARVQAEFPETNVYVCAIDSGLNDRGFIMPGLGDAGDRMFHHPS